MNTETNTAAKINTKGLNNLQVSARSYVDALVADEGVWGAIDAMQGSKAWYKDAVRHLAPFAQGDAGCKARLVKECLAYVDSLAEAAAEHEGEASGEG
jgi:hypothetical protein